MKIGEIFGYNPEVRTFAGHDALVLPRCMMGVEIEAERFDLVGKEIPHLWELSDDPSLRNQGMEVKFSAPLCGVDLVTALQQIEEYFKEIAVEYPLYRTSTHIHLDARDMELSTLRTLILAYITVERVLIQHVAPERGENHIFSLPYYKATGDEPYIAYLFQDDWGWLREGPRKASKYSAMNIKPLYQEKAMVVGGDAPRAGPAGGHRHGAMGTLEFRFFPSTSEYGKILHWVNLIQCLKLFAEAHREWEPGSFPRRMSEIGTEYFLELVFGERAKDMEYPGYANDLLEGCRCAQDIVFNMKEPEKWTQDTLLPKCRESKKDRVTHPFTRYKRKHNKEVV